MVEFLNMNLFALKKRGNLTLTGFQQKKLHLSFYISEMSEEDLQRGILYLTKEESALDVTTETEKKKINRLASQYRRLNEQCCLKRYRYLKKAIKEAIIEYHDDNLGQSVDV